MTDMKVISHVVILTLLLCGALQAQTGLCPDKTDSITPSSTNCSQSISSDTASDKEKEDPETFFPHSDTSRYWISGQSNTILQGHPAFHAKYTGPNSLLPRGEYKTSLVETLYLGLQASKNTELLFDVESAGGTGISQATGMGGFTNLDVVRNPTVGAAPYIARVMLHQIVPLSDSTTETTRGPLSLAAQLPVRRLELRLGKFGTADFFDTNSVGSDSHL